MMDPIWKTQDWFTIGRYYTQSFRRGSTAPLNSHDWDDIAQVALIRLWRQREQHDASRPFKPWCKTLIHNAMRHGLRARFKYSPKHKASKHKFYLRNPYRLLTKTVITTSLTEEVVYLPDAIDPRTCGTVIQHEDLGELSRKDAEALKAVLLHGSVAKAAKHSVKKSLKGSRKAMRVYNSLRDSMLNLRVAYQKAL